MKLGELVAVYGSLRSGLGNHRLLTTAERHEDGVIAEGKYHMLSLGGFPGLVQDKDNTSDIVVEVYTVESDARKSSLDSLEGYPSFYNREQVTLKDGRLCWVYFLNDPSYYYDRPVVDDGDWKRYLTSL